MNLLFLTNFFPPYHFGGYEELCAEVAEGLNKRGHHISILTSNRGDEKGCKAFEKDVYRVLHPDITSYPLGTTINFFWWRKKRVEENKARFKEIIRAVQPDVILVWGMWNLSYEFMSYIDEPEMVKRAHYIADYWPTLPPAWRLHWLEPASHGVMNFPKSILAKLALAILDREGNNKNIKLVNVCCVSRFIANKLAAANVVLGQPKVIYNGISLSDFHFENVPLKIDELTAKRLLYVGRLSQDKGVHILIEALGVLRKMGWNNNLDIVGSGDPNYTEKLGVLTRRLDIEDSVKFLGRVERKEIPRIYQDHDVLIVPSLCEDSSPRTIQEGMASGLVVIGSAIGGIPEIISDEENGLLFPPGDTEQLAVQIERIAQNPELSQRLARAGKKTIIEKFNIERMLDELEDYLEKLNAHPLSV